MSDPNRRSPPSSELVATAATAATAAASATVEPAPIRGDEALAGSVTASSMMVVSMNLPSAADDLCASIARRDPKGHIVDLLDRNRNVDQSDALGWPPLVHAAYTGDVRIVDELLRRKAQVNAATPELDTPLHWAILNDHPACVERLLEAGANPFTLNSRSQRPVDLCRSPEVAVLFNQPANTSGKDAPLSGNRLKRYILGAFSPSSLPASGVSSPSQKRRTFLDVLDRGSASSDLALLQDDPFPVAEEDSAGGNDICFAHQQPPPPNVILSNLNQFPFFGKGQIMSRSVSLPKALAEFSESLGFPRRLGFSSRDTTEGPSAPSTSADAAAALSASHAPSPAALATATPSASSEGRVPLVRSTSTIEDSLFATHGRKVAHPFSPTQRTGSSSSRSPASPRRLSASAPRAASPQELSHALAAECTAQADPSSPSASGTASSNTVSAPPVLTFKMKTQSTLRRLYGQTKALVTNEIFKSIASIVFVLLVEVFRSEFSAAVRVLMSSFTPIITLVSQLFFIPAPLKALFWALFGHLSYFVSFFSFLFTPLLRLMQLLLSPLSYFATTYAWPVLGALWTALQNAGLRIWQPLFYILRAAVQPIVSIVSLAVSPVLTVLQRNYWPIIVRIAKRIPQEISRPQNVFLLLIRFVDIIVQQFTPGWLYTRLYRLSHAIFGERWNALADNHYTAVLLTSFMVLSVYGCIVLAGYLAKVFLLVLHSALIFLYGEMFALSLMSTDLSSSADSVGLATYSAASGVSLLSLLSSSSNPLVVSALGHALPISLVSPLPDKRIQDCLLDASFDYRQPATLPELSSPLTPRKLLEDGWWWPFARVLSDSTPEPASAPRAQPAHFPSFGQLQHCFEFAFWNGTHWIMSTISDDLTSEQATQAPVAAQSSGSESSPFTAPPTSLSAATASARSSDNARGSPHAGTAKAVAASPAREPAPSPLCQKARQGGICFAPTPLLWKLWLDVGFTARREREGVWSSTAVCPATSLFLGNADCSNASLWIVDSSGFLHATVAPFADRKSASTIDILQTYKLLFRHSSLALPSAAEASRAASSGGWTFARLGKLLGSLPSVNVSFFAADFSTFLLSTEEQWYHRSSWRVDGRHLQLGIALILLVTVAGVLVNMVVFLIGLTLVFAAAKVRRLLD